MKSRDTILIAAVVFAVLFVLAIGFIPFRGGHRTSPQNACINNLRYIDAAKEQWAIDNHKTNGPVSWNDILPYLTRVQQEQGRKVEMPHCPAGGVYTLGNIEDLPKCSIKGHETMR